MNCTHHSDQASEWVRRFAPLVPDGEVLDLACGHGRHSRLFAAAGHSVLAVDRDADALATLAAFGITTLRMDLEGGSPWPFEESRFSGIIITNYLHRPLFPEIFNSLCDGGVLIVETFAAGNEQFGKPSNPDFLLAPGELLAIAAAHASGNLHIIAYEDGYVAHPRPAMVQRICLAKSDFRGKSRCFPLI